MKIAKIILTLSFILTVLMIPVFLVFVTGAAAPPEHISTMDELYALIQEIRNWIYGLLALIVVIFLLIAAYYFITAAGSEEKVKSGREMVKYAIIGIVIMLLAAGVFGIIESVVDTGGSGGSGNGGGVE